MLALMHSISLLRIYSIFSFTIEIVNAALTFTNPSLADLTAGASFNVTWSGASGTTTLSLENGTASSINTVGVIASGIKNSFIIWSPYATVPSATYVLHVTDTSGQSAYSSQFTMLGSGTKTSSTTGLQFTNPTLQGITAGSPFNITWEGANGSTTLTLQKGTSNSISTVDVISSNIGNPYIVWSPYATTPTAQYVLRLDDTSGGYAYSNLFDMVVKNAGVAVATTTVSSSPSSTPTQSADVASSATTSAITPISSPKTSSSVSTGATVGIAVGAVIIALTLIGAGVVFLRRKRNDKLTLDSHTEKDEMGRSGSGSPYETTPFGASNFQKDHTRGKVEVEAQSRAIPVEIGGGREYVYEVDGGGTNHVSHR